MDCCSKYSQYRSHSMSGSILGNIDNRHNINNGSIGYYSHLHQSSLRYQQQQQQQPPSLYRLNNSSGSLYNGIGPPPTSIPISPHTNLHHQNYDHRYGHSYTNLSSYSSYTNSNSYNCNNVNFRGMMNDYYNHCDSYTRMNGIGGSTNFSYYGYRDFYDINLHHNPRINSYNNMYTNPLGEREFHHHHHHHQHHQHHQHHSHHQNIGYYHTLPNSYYNNNNNHHNRYLYHHNHHTGIGNNNYNSQLRGASKDTFMSRIPSDIHKSNITTTNEKDLCDDTSNNLHTSSSVSPSLQTNTTNNNNNNNNSSCINDTNKLDQFHRNYNPYSNCKTDPNYNDDTIDEKINHQQQSTISNDTEENQTDHQSYESNEYKSKKSITKDKDKLSNRQNNSANRKAECSTPMNNLSTFEHDGSSFTSDNYFYSTKNSNYSNLQNGYHSPSQSSSCCSPFSNSPNNWNQRYSPKLSRKRCHSPKSSPSSLISSITINKNRILEFDFIPSKKSKRKIKSESSEENYEYREEIKGITPLPGFQQAFGSTEIGRFSETFFSAIDSPVEFRYESEADTLSPQPWETGDSLDGPHYNLYIGASVQPMYSDNFNSIDSSIDSNHFNEIQCSDY